MQSLIVSVVFSSLFLFGSAFTTLPRVKVFSSSKLQLNSIASSGFNIAELFSGPAARYNGELIDKSLKLIEKSPKPEGYEYGAVSSDAVGPLIAGMVFVLIVGALVPYFLSIGEAALSQQRERELTDKTTVNEFTLKAKQQQDKKNKK